MRAAPVLGRNTSREGVVMTTATRSLAHELAAEFYSARRDWLAARTARAQRDSPATREIEAATLADIDALLDMYNETCDCCR
jgi:hypothetical protein